MDRLGKHPQGAAAVGGAGGLHGDPERAVGEGHALRPPAERRRARSRGRLGSRWTSVPPTSSVTQTPSGATATPFGAAPTGIGVGHDRPPGVDAGDASRRGCSSPRRRRCRRRPRWDRCRRGSDSVTVPERASMRTSALPTGSVTQTAPPPTAIPRAAASTSIGCPARAGHGIDLRDAPVVGVRDPDRAGAEGDPGRRVPDLDRVADLPVGRRVDARDGAVERVGHPDGSRADGDPDRPVADLDRVDDVVALGIEAHDAAAAARARHPDRALAGRHPLRRGDLGRPRRRSPATAASTTPTALSWTRASVRAPARSSSEREDRNRHRRREHTREGADHERPAVERPTSTGGGRDELVLPCPRTQSARRRSGAAETSTGSPSTSSW